MALLGWLIRRRFLFQIGMLSIVEEVTMAYWLLKTEPSTYSYADLERDKHTVWEGVRNNQALQNLRRIQKGDLAFIYHTGDEKSIVGIALVVSDPYPDRNLKDPKRVVVDLKPKQRLKNSIPLTKIKAHPKLKAFDLVRNSRLSVMTVTEEEWKILMGMAGEKE
ncbi:MAG: EVE domain-containing protein [Terriglobia bacterium]